MRKLRLALLPILCIVALAGGAYLGMRSHSLPAATLGEIRLPDVNKQLQHADRWRGKVVVVNHWASWCGPCREEMPMLVDYQTRHSAQVQIIGVAHDLIDNARAFGAQLGINYPSLVAITQGEQLMRAQGNHSGALPYTAVFDRNGNLADSHLGLLSEAQLDALVAPLR